MKKLPIGIQTFSQIIEENYTYVDKTGIAYELIKNHKYVFLSRPRRFGKSLFLDTLHQIFESNKSLFKGLLIEEQWDWNTEYPVIRISFGGAKIKSEEELNALILGLLRSNQTRLDIQCEDKTSISNCFRELLEKLYNKHQQKVVILVDEYDKPILDNITNSKLAHKLRDKLANLYSGIKDNDHLIKFAFITGVSKFTKTSIFSGLNNLEDISLSPEFGNICGYTQKDLETVFKEHLKGVDMTKVKEWYNGYNFLGSLLYNPFDILQFIRSNFVFRNYWFKTGTPSFLIELIKANQYHIPNLSNIVATESLLERFDIDNLNLETVLYQSGYLTIESMEFDEDEDLIYTLKIPNREVRVSLNEYIIMDLYYDNPVNAKPLSKALREDNLEAFKSALISIFAAIPYNNYANNPINKYEGFYASIVFVYLHSLGLNIITEGATNRGRIDLTILMPKAIYIIEFKVDSKEAPLKQIIERGYADKYKLHNKPIYLVGIEFDSQEKNIKALDYRVA